MKRIGRIFFVFASLTLALAASAQPNGAGSPTPAADARLALPASDDGLPGAGPLRRQAVYQRTWLQRRALWAQRVEQDQHALVFLGDSIMQGWGDDMGGNFPGVKVANRGISGDTTRGVLIRLKEDVLPLHPSGVVLLIGCNDLADGIDPEIIANNLKLIVTELEKSDAKMPIALCAMFPSSPRQNRPVEKVKEVNRLYAAAVKGDPQVTLVETWILFTNAVGDAKPEEFPDLLHPNKAGYAKWAAGLRPLLATYGLMDNEPFTFTPDPGFTSLFNGHDLTGWGFLTNNFDGQTSSMDGRYAARNGRLIVMTSPLYRKIQKLSTTRKFPKDFILKLEFRSMPFADSGIFIRAPQLQCRDYSLAGPYYNLPHYKPQEWNEIVITVKGNSALCTCNGDVMEEAYQVPSTGPIGLEGDRGQMEYRRIQFKELPEGTAGN